MARIFARRVGRRVRAIVPGLLLVLACLLLGTDARAANLANKAVVFPGFAPIEVDGLQVRLGDRVYDWQDTFLPVVYSRGSVIAALNLRLGVAGESILATPTKVSVVSSSPTRVIVKASGEPVPGLAIKVTTRVEIDGVAMVTVTVLPKAPIDVDALDFEADVSANPMTRMLKFQTADIRSQARDHAIDPSYAGPFLNAVGIADGDRSFWWFADNAEGWIWNGDTVTELGSTAPDRLRLRQRLIGAQYRIAKRMTMKMNFLATPVRELGSEWRRERLTGGVSSEEGQLGKIQGWWSTAFAHTALPFTEPPAVVVSQIPATDQANYPGLAANREILIRNLEVKGIHSLPYFSGHCLSEIDAKLTKHRPAWEVDPPFVVMSVDSSYPTPFEKPALSHRARGYGNYVIGRLNSEIDKLGMTGIYLDHASIMDSRNPKSGAWTDSNGNVQASTDILGMRSFLKRLRTLFHVKGKPGYILVHASNSELVPAYTFATAIVDGEQFRHRLAANDYIASMPLDQVRMQNAPGQYGLRNVWIPQFDRFNASDPTWPGSLAERKAFRNFLTLVLLHDGEFWPSYVPQDERLALLGALDTFGTDQAGFRGYWSTAPLATTSLPAARISAYERPDALLLVVGNLSSTDESVDVVVDLAGAGLPATATARLVPDDVPLELSAGRIDLTVPAKDFRLIEIR
jgi:hypothetical protein